MSEEKYLREHGREEFASILRELLLEMAARGWQARGLGLTEEELLVAVAQAAEPVVQSIVQKMVPR